MTTIRQTTCDGGSGPAATGSNWLPEACLRLAVVGLLAMVAAPRLPGAENDAAAEDVNGGVLVIANGGEPRGLDPQLVTGVIEGNIVRALFEGLCIPDPIKDGAALPGAAERWEANADSTVWTFHLRRDGKWSDGQPLTASDFLYSFERILTPAFNAGYAEMLYFIAGAEEFHRGESDEFDDVGVEAVDDFTLRVTLRRPAPYLAEICKHHSWFPVPRHIVSKLNAGRIENPDVRWTRPENLVCNGPFKLASWRPEETLEVTKNDRYWDAETVRLQGVRFLPIVNKRAAARRFFDGELHITHSLPPELADYARRHSPGEVHRDLYLGTRFVRCNTSRPPLADARVRRALSLALNRKAILQDALAGLHEPAYGLVPPFGRYDTRRQVAQDAAEAKRLLAEAGIANPKDLPQLTLLTNDNEAAKAIAEACQARWESVLGIKVAIEQKPWIEYIRAIHSLEYDLVDSGWIGDYVDPGTFLNLWVEDGPNNCTSWSSEDYERLLKRADGNQEPEKRYEILHEAEKLFLEEMPAIPIYWYTVNSLRDKSVEGWHPLVLGNQPYKFLSLSREREPGKGEDGVPE